MKNFFEGILGGVGVLLGALIIAVLGSIPLWLCWNYVMPDLFGLPEIKLLQALALAIIANVLVKSSSK